MASTYTGNSGIEKPGTGEQSGTWGTTTNTNFDIIDRVLGGVGSISLSGTTHTLTTTDGTLSDGMYKVLVFGGSPSGTNTVTISPNDQQKLYYAKNDSGQSVVITQGSGSNVTINNGETRIVYADGAGSGAAVVDLTATLAAGVPSGTKQLFVQTSAPTGWTKDTSNNNDSAVRIVTGSVGLGDESVVGTCNLTLTGVSGATALGDEGIETDTGAPVTNVPGMTSALGDETVTISVTPTITGFGATSALGSVSVTGTSVLTLTGTEGSGNISSVIVWGRIVPSQNANWNEVAA